MDHRVRYLIFFIFYFLLYGLKVCRLIYDISCEICRLIKDKEHCVIDVQVQVECNRLGDSSLNQRGFDFFNPF